MQAIVTKFVGATNHQGSRIIAKCQAKRMVVPWDHSLDVQANHEAAARALAQKLGWLSYGQWIGGAMPDDSGYCYVCATPIEIRIGP